MLLVALDVSSDDKAFAAGANKTTQTTHLITENNNQS
jgi:hypothetical protein